MRILLDECLPRRLRRHFPGHEVRTVTEMGWSGLKNGMLIRAMQGRAFEVLLTIDKNLRHQQNLSQAAIALVVLDAPTNRFDALLPLIPSAVAVLATIRPGDVIVIGP